MYKIVSSIGFIIRCCLPGIEISPNMPWWVQFVILCGGIEAVVHIIAFITTGIIMPDGSASDRSGLYTLMYILYYLTTIPLFFYNVLHWWSIPLTIILMGLLFSGMIFFQNDRD